MSEKALFRDHHCNFSLNTIYKVLSKVLSKVQSVSITIKIIYSRFSETQSLTPQICNNCKKNLGQDQTHVGEGDRAADGQITIAKALLSPCTAYNETFRPHKSTVKQPIDHQIE